MTDYLIAILIACLAMLASGCQSTADAIKGLGDDHASVSATVVTPWGTSRVTRINPQPGQTVKVSPDGSIEASGGRP